MTRATQWTAIASILVGLGVTIQQTAQADTARIDDITIDRQPDETYDSLIQRAESAARTAVQQSFDRAQITEVSVVILGQNQGVIAPVLTVEVSRPQWSSGNNAQDGFTYFNSARSLLRLEEQQLATADSPPEQRNTPVPPRRQQNTPRTPSNSREIINNAPIAPATPAPGANPLPGSPALVPRPQAPGVAPVTSPGNNENTGNNVNTTSPGNNEGQGNNVNTTAPPPSAPVTAPSSDNLPQVNPANPTPNQRQDL